MRLRSRRRTIVTWPSSSSSSGRVARHGVHVVTRSTRARRIRWRVRTILLLAIIRALRLARTYPRPALSLAGTAVTVAGITLPSGAVLVSGFLVLFLTMFLPSDPAAASRPRDLLYPAPGHAVRGRGPDNPGLRARSEPHLSLPA